MNVYSKLMTHTAQRVATYMSVACVLIIITCFVVSQIVTLEYTYVLNFTTGRSCKSSSRSSAKGPHNSTKRYPAKSTEGGGTTEKGSTTTEG